MGWPHVGGKEPTINRPLAAAIADVNVAIANTGMSRRMIVYIKITAVSGTDPTMRATLQHSPNGSDWFDLEDVYAGNVTGNYSRRFEMVGKSVRLHCAIAGTTPSFTFEVQTSREA